MKTFLALLSCALVLVCMAINMVAEQNICKETELFPKNEVTYLTQYKKEVLCP